MAPKRLVDVVFVPVAFVQVRLVGFKEPTKRFVNAAFVAKRFVEVELTVTMFVPVLALNVKFCSDAAPPTVTFDWKIKLAVEVPPAN